MYILFIIPRRRALVLIFLCSMMLHYEMRNHVCMHIDGDVHCTRIMRFVPEKGNPRYYACYLDEDMINRMKLGAGVHVHVEHVAIFACMCSCLRRVVERTHPSTMSVRALEHYCLLASMRWTGGFNTTPVLE